MRPELRVPQGGRSAFGGGIVAAVELHPPFPIEARVYEEDRWLVLSSPLEPQAVAEHPIRLMTALWEAEPRSLGSVVVQSGRPLRLLAVVHDLDEEPTCRSEWIAKAWRASLAEVGHRALPKNAG